MLTFNWDNPFTLQWTLTDGAGNPVNSAAVTATLYVGRSQLHPDRTPGTAVSGWSDLNLAYQANSAGIYQYSVPADVVPDPSPAGNYILVIDATVGGVSIGHWEELVTVVVNS